MLFILYKPINVAHVLNTDLFFKNMFNLLQLSNFVYKNLGGICSQVDNRNVIRYMYWLINNFINNVPITSLDSAYWGLSYEIQMYFKTFLN